MQLSDLPRVMLAIGRVMADSTKTAEIHVVEELTGREHFAAFLRKHQNDSELAELLATKPELRSDQVDFDALRQLPAGTLGSAYVHHLDDNGITADSQAAKTRYLDGEPENLAYLVRRFRQTHDVWHVLLDLGIEGHEEVLIHAFSYGQLRLPVSALVVTFGTLKHIVGEGRWRTLREDLVAFYKAGREASPLMPVHWEAMFDQPLDDVRARYDVVPPKIDLR